MRTIKLTIEYDGTHYVGWQRQPNGVSVQEKIEAALRTMTGEDIDLLAASRTDSGVHAVAQAASFRTHATIPCTGFLQGLPSLLPRDIAIKTVAEVTGPFHPIRSATGKSYRYFILNDMIPSSLLRDRAWHVMTRLNIADMRRAARYFVGRRDFSSFMAKGATARHAVRTVTALSIRSTRQPIFGVVPTQHGRFVEITVTGNGFVRNQVRNMVGTLVAIGAGKLRADQLPDILVQKKRSAAGPCAPPHGLYLLKVQY